jgi:hypothetical protein
MASGRSYGIASPGHSEPRMRGDAPRLLRPPPRLGDGPLPETVTVQADGGPFEARLRLDTPMEVAYYRSGGDPAYLLRELARS